MRHKAMIGLFSSAVLILAAHQARAVDPEMPADPCIGCHSEATPGIVRKWEQSNHAPAGIKCYVCHVAGPDAPATAAMEEHQGYQVTAAIPVARCEGCHPQELTMFTSQWEKVVNKVHGRR